jgi:hypothetical protein
MKNNKLLKGEILKRIRAVINEVGAGLMPRDNLKFGSIDEYRNQYA